MITTTVEFDMAVWGNKNAWVPACGGTETPFISRSGVKLLYCFNPFLGRHAYLNVDQDIVLTDPEAQAYKQI